MKRNVGDWSAMASKNCHGIRRWSFTHSFVTLELLVKLVHVKSRFRWSDCGGAPLVLLWWLVLGSYWRSRRDTFLPARWKVYHRRSRRSWKRYMLICYGWGIFLIDLNFFLQLKKGKGKKNIKWCKNKVSLQSITKRVMIQETTLYYELITYFVWKSNIT